MQVWKALLTAFYLNTFSTVVWNFDARLLWVLSEFWGFSQIYPNDHSVSHHRQNTHSWPYILAQLARHSYQLVTQWQPPSHLELFHKCFLFPTAFPNTETIEFSKGKFREILDRRRGVWNQRNFSTDFLKLTFVVTDQFNTKYFLSKNM